MPSRLKRPGSAPALLPGKPALCRRMFDRMLTVLGPQNWWPADTDEEVIIGAVLTQNTAWTNVEKALSNLRASNALTLQAVSRLPPEELARRIQPAGYYNLKARRLQCVARYFLDRCGGDLNALGAVDTAVVREELLAVYGVGPETADSILLYVLRRPVFVIDAYTLRIGARHGLFAPETPYEQARAFFERSLPADRALYNEYHALLVRVGNRHCRPRPRCAGCPLASPDCGWQGEKI